MQSANKTRAGYFMLVFSLIGVFSAVSHYLPPPDAATLAQVNPPPGKEWFEEQLPRYATYPIMTALHVIPAIMFMILVPIQLASRVRQKNINVHRWIGRSFIILSISIGISGIAMGIIMPFGGDTEVLASLLIGTGFLVSLAMGVVRVRQKRIGEHRQWMIRMLAFGFTPITMRGLMTAGVMGFDMKGIEIFGPSLIVAMIINVIVVEGWIIYTRQKAGATPNLITATTT